MTVETLITQSFVDLATIAPGATITNVMRDAAFALLNQMYSGWSAEEVMVFNRVHQSFSLTASLASYTLGSGGTLATTGGLRPVRVTGWQSISGSFRNGGEIMSIEQFHAATKDGIGRRSVLAEAVGADGNYPLINIRIFPIPDTSPGTLELDYFTPLVQFAAVTDVLAHPDGYEDALRAGLAVALYPQYARPGVSLEVLAAAAQRTKGIIAARNAAILGMQKAA